METACLTHYRGYLAVSGGLAYRLRTWHAHFIGLSSHRGHSTFKLASRGDQKLAASTNASLGQHCIQQAQSAAIKISFVRHCSNAPLRPATAAAGRARLSHICADSVQLCTVNGPSQPSSVDLPVACTAASLLAHRPKLYTVVYRGIVRFKFGNFGSSVV